MIRDNQPALLAATGVVSLAIGFGAATLLTPQRPANQQIVNPNAWEEAAPDGLMPVSYAVSPKAAKCDPFDVSEVAMEAMLDEMQRRGWRAPSQGYAVSMVDPADTMGIEAVDPNAPMIPRGGWPRSASDGETVEQLPVDQESPDAAVVIEPEAPAAPTAEQRAPA
jgi:hypothetical protein